MIRQKSIDVQFITRQLLAFARKQVIQPVVLDLNNAIAAILKMLRRLIGEDIALAWLPGAEVWPVKTFSTPSGWCRNMCSMPTSIADKTRIQ